MSLRRMSLSSPRPRVTAADSSGNRCSTPSTTIVRLAIATPVRLPRASVDVRLVDQLLVLVRLPGQELDGVPGRLRRARLEGTGLGHDELSAVDGEAAVGHAE